MITVGGAELRLEIWDTGGTEKYKALAPMYYRDARAAIIVFDVTNKQSFIDAAEWLADFRERGHPTAIVVCAGNKIDLVRQRVVQKEEAEEFAAENGLDFFVETSALEGTNVAELFEDLAKRLLQATPLTGGQFNAGTQRNEGCPC
jgi:Ras-related protein Rab-5C